MTSVLDGAPQPSSPSYRKLLSLLPGLASGSFWLVSRPITHLPERVMQRLFRESRKDFSPGIRQTLKSFRRRADIYPSAG